MPSGVSKPKRSRKTPTLNSYVYKVLKQSHPGLSISKTALACTSALAQSLGDRISVKGGELARSEKKTTLGARHIQAAVRLMLPSELAKHAVSEGTKAVAKYTSV